MYLRFPNFRQKALTLSYDDGVTADKRLIDIMSKYGVKGTFNICSGLYGNSDKPTNLTKQKAVEVYDKYGAEVAIHGKKHLPLTEVDMCVAYNDVLECREDLEKDFKRIIRGFAYAYGFYNDNVINMLKDCGIVYARTVGGTENFVLPQDWYRWQGTCHHQELPLCQ